MGGVLAKGDQVRIMVIDRLRRDWKGVLGNSGVVLKCKGLNL